MKPSSLLPSMLCALGLALAAVAAAQSPPMAPPPGGGHPPGSERFREAVETCRIDAGDDPDDPAGPDDFDDPDDPMGPALMDLCMSDKGFDHPPGPPPRPRDGPPPPPPRS